MAPKKQRDEKEKEDAGSSKRKAEAEVPEMMPASRPKIAALCAASAELPEAWREPGGSEIDVWAEILQPWLLQTLPQALKNNVNGYSGEAFDALLPGQIQSTDSSVSASFRERWSCNNAQAALEKHGQ